MPKLLLCDLELDVPSNWKDQGMITLTLPSTDKNIRPNIIVTKERLPQQVDLNTYFQKIKQSIQSRNIKSFEILDERDLQVGGVAAKQMVCRWDLSAMKDMNRGGQNLEHIKEGQMVQQIQLSLIKGDYAVNFTASFPAEQYPLYERPFMKFVTGMKFVG